MSAFSAQQRGIDGPEDWAIAERFPAQTVLHVQHDLERIGFPTLALAGAEKDVEHLRPGAPVPVKDQDNRMQSLLWKSQSQTSNWVFIPAL
jgi:hypothetical protein